ncbi:MAG: hypothetical protein ACP5E4_01925 [Candidatus Aenigmatarchaeota archaeon]
MSGQILAGNNGEWLGCSVFSEGIFSLVRLDRTPVNVEIYMMENGRQIGVSGVSLSQIPTLASIKVEPAGNGYGTKFMDLLEMYFKSLGYETSCVDAWGYVVPFFVKRGYEVKERDPPTYFMMKPLV